MAPPAPVTNFALKSIIEKDKMNGTNFTTWYRNLRIVLKHDKKENVLEEPLPEEPADNATAAAKNAYQKLKDESTEISCLMLASMEPEMQQQFEDIRAFYMIEGLKGMFQVQARTERFEVWRSLMDCKLKEGDPLSPHVIKMMGYMQALDRLGHPLTPESATDTILGSLPPSYNSFITSFHMHGMEKKPTELHGMLKIAEQDIKKGTHQVLMVQNTTKFKKSWSTKKANAKGKDKDVILTPALSPSPNLMTRPFASVARRIVTGRGTATSGSPTRARAVGVQLLQVH